MLLVSISPELHVLDFINCSKTENWILVELENDILFSFLVSKDKTHENIHFLDSKPELHIGIQILQLEENWTRIWIMELTQEMTHCLFSSKKIWSGYKGEPMSLKLKEPCKRTNSSKHLTIFSSFFWVFLILDMLKRSVNFERTF